MYVWQSTLCTLAQQTVVVTDILLGIIAYEESKDFSEFVTCTYLLLRCFSVLLSTDIADHPTVRTAGSTVKIKLERIIRVEKA